MKGISFLFLFSLAFFSVGLCKDVSSQPAALPRIIFKGHVKEAVTREPIAARVTIETAGNEILDITADAYGRFSTTLTASSKLTIITSANGYDLEEEVLEIPGISSDTTLHYSVELQPSSKMKITGMIMDEKTHQPIAAEFDLFLDNDVEREEAGKVKDGKYEETITNYGWYLINVSSPGYLTKTDTIWVVNDSRPELRKDFMLTPIEAGLTVRLDNIQFDFGKTTLRSESFQELNTVVDMLAHNPTVKLEIGGHTDSEGPDDYNLYLSQGRAQAVVDYLISQGVSAGQLEAKGYGETKPIDASNTRAAKQLNRRVEFTVLKN